MTMRLASRARPGSFFRALLFALLPATCTAQTAHDLVMGRELAFTGAGLGTSGIGLVLRRSNARRPASGNIPVISGRIRSSSASR